MKSWLFHATSLALLMWAAPAASQQDTLRAAWKTFGGCYVVELGAWDRSLHGNAAYHMPPDTVILDSVLVRGALRTPGFALRPHVPILTRYHTVPARWWRTAEDSVQLWWSSGFGGVALYLGRLGADLSGHAEAFSDVIPVEIRPDGSQRRTPWPAAPVVLRRIQCR